MKHMLAALALGVGLAGPVAVQAAEPQFKLLVIASPSKYHFEFIPVARESLMRMARLHAFEIEWATNAEPLEGELGRYAAVMLLNTAVEDLNDAQRARFEAYMTGGGNAVVVHRAAIVVPAKPWPWYEKLVGRSVGVHPMLQTGVVTVEDAGFPAAYGIPARWVWSDEFYTTTNPYRVTISPVLNVDETSYDPTKIWPGQVSRPMGPAHPVAWYHHYGKSRVFVTTLGHDGEAYRDGRYLDHLLGGIYWTASGLGQRRLK